MYNLAQGAEGRIQKVLASTDCRRHKADVETPCWVLHLNAGRFAPAVCGSRVKRAGYNGDIRESSLRSTNAATKKR